MSLDRCSALPPRAAIDTVVVIAAGSLIVGCARLAGVVSLTAPPSPFEHPSARSIRASLGIHAALFGPNLWVFEDGITFDAAIRMDPGDDGDCWIVPPRLVEPIAASIRASIAAWQGSR